MYSAPFLAALLFSVAVLVCSETLNDTDTLLSDLFTGYNKKLRGTFDQSVPIHINISISLFTIETLDVVEQRLGAMLAIGVRWTDERLTWDPNTYNGTSHLTLPKDDIWVPEIALANPAKNVNRIGKDGSILRIDNTGSVDWFIVDIFTSRCPANVAYFPHDTQTCPVRFVASGRYKDEIILRPMTVESSSLESNEEWELISIGIYDDPIFPVSTTTLTLTLKRHPAFVFVNLVCPILLIGMLNICVFLIPAESGERISFCITVFLSLALFLSFISGQLPSNSQTMAVICYFLLVALLFSTIIAFLVILNLRLYFRDDTDDPVPNYIMSIMNRIGCCKKELSPPIKSNQVVVCDGSLTSDSEQPMDKSEERTCSTRLTWKTVSCFVDKACMYFMFPSYFIVTLTTLMFISLM